MSARSEAKERRPKAGHEAEQAGRRSRILEHVFGLHTRSRRVISEHRHRPKLRDREVSDRSRRGLDWTNFFLADVQMSFPVEVAVARGGLDAARPKLMGFLERIHARPAYKRALEKGGPYQVGRG